MGDLIGKQVDGTLHFVGEDGFAGLRELELSPDDRVATFADLCRINALYMIAKAGSGHIGSSFSSLDIVAHILLRVLRTGEASSGLYFSSKGHDAPGLYAALIGLGRLPQASLHLLRRLDGLPGHPDVNTPGIVTNTGSLGMGISKAKGMIRAHRAQGLQPRVVVLTGDGELQEGQIWESLAGAVEAKMDELLVVVDHNKLQSDTLVRATSDLGDLPAKFRAFGFHVMRVDGHDQAALARATDEAERLQGKPSVLIADTIKGAGVSFMEHTSLTGKAPRYRFHSGAPDAESYRRAVQELRQRVVGRLGYGCSFSPLHAVQVKAGPAGTQAESLHVAYGRALLVAAERDTRLTVYDADLAFDLGLMPFKERFPDRFVECGIAEMDMVSQAGGAALRGQRPLCHSFACFLTPRANEQIYNNASEGTPVVYVGGLAGLLPAGPGHSHQGVRDISVLGAIPGLTCLAPSCAHEVGLALQYALEASGPVYIRLCAVPVDPPFATSRESAWVAGQGRCIREGSDGAIITYGPVMSAQAYVAATQLAAAGQLDVAVYTLPFLNSVDGAWLARELAGKRFLLTVDDHYRFGGQGQMLAAEVAALGLGLPVSQLGIVGWPACGEDGEVLRHHGLHADDVAQHLLRLGAGRPS